MQNSSKTATIDYQKINKEMLMVSVLPAHIALEMKTEMLMKTRKAQMRSIRENYMMKKENPSFVIIHSTISLFLFK
jgi:hypothetical protein